MNAIEKLMALVVGKIRCRKARDEMFFVLVSQVSKLVTFSSRLISTLSHALPHPCTVTLVVPVWCVTLSHPKIWAGRSSSSKSTVTLSKIKNWQLLTCSQYARMCGKELLFVASSTRNTASLAQQSKALCIYMYLEENKKWKSRRGYH